MRATVAEISNMPKEGMRAMLKLTVEALSSSSKVVTSDTRNLFTALVKVE